jgi:hypothetical protein
MKTFGIIVVFVLVMVLLFVISKSCSVVNKVTDVDNAFINYEQFQEIWNTCQKLNTDMGIMRDLPETDKMFEQFSKVQRLSTLKIQLNKWVEDYNAKSKMWNRSLWKSKSLPYQLTVNEFTNY